MKKFLLSFCLMIISVIGFGQESASLGLAPIKEFQPWSVPVDLTGLRGYVYTGSVSYQLNATSLSSTSLFPIGSMVSFGFPGAAPYNIQTGLIWACDQMSPYTLYTVDTITGIRIAKCNITGCPEPNLTGITWNSQGTVLYGQTTNLTTSSIGIINTLTGVFSPIGPPSSILQGAITLSCPTNGNLFSVDVVTDKLYKINKTTGEVSIVGPIGLDVIYGQDAQFDQWNDRLFWTAYTSNGPQLRVIDTSTGSSILIGNYQCQVMTIGIGPRYLGISPDFNTVDLIIFPNPTKDFVKISNPGILYIEVYSQAGQLLQKTIVNSDFADISLAEYGTGIYIIKIFTEAKVITKKLTVLK